MEFHYNVTIKSSKNMIEFKMDKDNSKNDAITGVKFGFNSDDATKERDRNGRVEIVISGKFNGDRDTLSAIRQLSEWAKSNDDVYREVTIVMETSDEEAGENFSRTYHFDKMFCIDYFERTGCACESSDKDAGLEFELFMAQAPTYKISETEAVLV